MISSDLQWWDYLAKVPLSAAMLMRSDLNQLTEGEGSPWTKQPRTTETPPPAWSWSSWHRTCGGSANTNISVQRVKNFQLLLGIQNEKIICFCLKYWINCLYFICKSLAMSSNIEDKMRWQCWLDDNSQIKLGGTHRAHWVWGWRAGDDQHRWQRSRCSPRRLRGPRTVLCSRPRHRPHDPPGLSPLTCARQCWAGAARRPRTSDWRCRPAWPSSGRSSGPGRSWAGLKHSDFHLQTEMCIMWSQLKCRSVLFWTKTRVFLLTVKGSSLWAA